MFSEEKVAQMAAYLLSKGGGRMAYLKLIKLLYLSDRQSMDTYGDSISGDRFVAMKHGPVLSQTYDLVKNGGEEESGWNHWIQGAENYEVALKHQEVSVEDLDELSEADIEILDNVMAEFGHMSKYQIRDYTHDHCAEWQDPGCTSVAITPYATFTALGRSRDVAAVLQDRIFEREQLDRALSAYKFR
ncbi:hypothetical protein B2M27_26645 [Kluyvera intermedia]|uniref:Antitoxin SocA-like Panacea domain-containing protein n=1 Tax=Kluyvera intermedia TaxID=61648 RepID=A0ABX3U7V5_KLUIN|nr:Panacea domain-containing protein [Kluyvera intermedia]ORJ47319.1 hypothetical protein B2M27_26645 [Kluyvera intermedia]